MGQMGKLFKQEWASTGEKSVVALPTGTRSPSKHDARLLCRRPGPNWPRSLVLSSAVHRLRTRPLPSTR
eukprot:6174569-Pleurochrysis_carterae.AAC.2